MKLVRLLSLVFLPFTLWAQNTVSSSDVSGLIKNYLNEKKTEWKLTEADINNWMLSDLYSNSKTGMIYAYMHQQVDGIRIFNAVSSISIRDNVVKTFSKRIYNNAEGRINATNPALSQVDAIRAAAKHLEINPEGKITFLSENTKLNRSYFSAPGISSESIRVELIYQPLDNKLILAWDVNVRLDDKSHWWNIRIDAVSGKYLQKNDWVSQCDFDLTPSGNPPALQQSNGNTLTTTSLPSYRVYPLPFESPSDGPSALIADPSDPVASPFGWHDNNGVAGAEFTITRGNNVFAYDDMADQDAPGTSPDGTASLTFDFPFNLANPPSTYLSGSTTNLFYVNNWIHDVLYHNGFDEPAGNFQDNNYGNGGSGGDYVIAECQDGGGTNNANFATPDDGQNGRMQMYLWASSVQSVLVGNSPAPIVGNYSCVPAGFGPGIPAPITQDLILVDDGNGTPTDACEPPFVNAGSINGKIALIDRGSCDFVDKVLAAENAGAVAVVMINNAPGAPFAMGDNGNGFSVGIPAVMISQANGNLFKSTITGGSTVNITLNPPPSGASGIDGSLDNGIVIHEYGHGVSNRLTGGPNNSSCLWNGEEGGEGWSDYFSLLFTMKPGDLGTDSRGIGTYALGQPSTGDGIRRFPYSTNMSVNPQTYGDLAQSSEVHDIGEIWCVTLWEMTWGLVDQFGFDADWINGTSGNNIALQLVLEGMKLQPCSPGFLDGRDAILLADDNLFGGVHKCIIWEAFAKRGMGFSADQGNSDIAGDESESFDLPPLCLMPTQAPTANFIANNTTTCFGLVQFTDQSTDIPQQFSWDFGDGNTSILQHPTHQYTTSGVFTVTLIVTNTLGADTMVRNAYINVNFPVSPGISGDTLLCPGETASLTAAAAGGNTVEWYQGGSLVSSGASFNTPALFSNTSYQVIQYTPTTLQNVGPGNTGIGGGSYHATSFEGRLLFTVIAPMRLKSVFVDANGTMMRTINLYQGNTLIQSMGVNIPNGQSRIDLNIDIQTPGDYQIGVAAGSDLFRNNSGASYPYTIGGLVSITLSNSTTNPSNYYYYLYDWEVQELPCQSAPLDVNIVVNPGPQSTFSHSETGLSVQLTDVSTGSPVAWDWDFGDGTTSNLPNPQVVYSTSGTYLISLTVTDANGCQSVSSQLVTVTNVGVADIEKQDVSIYNQSNDLIVRFNNTVKDASIVIYDAIGKVVYETVYSGELFKLPLNRLASESLFVRVNDGREEYSKKMVFVH